MHAVLAPAVAHPHHGLLGFASMSTLPQSSINHTPTHMILPMPTLLESPQCSLNVVCVCSQLSLSAALHVTIFPDSDRSQSMCQSSWSSGYHLDLVIGWVHHHDHDRDHDYQTYNHYGHSIPYFTTVCMQSSMKFYSIPFQYSFLTCFQQWNTPFHFIAESMSYYQMSLLCYYLPWCMDLNLDSILVLSL